MTNDDNKWVFLSHSNKDFAKVRLVRDQLELKDLRPIMLYLKCFEGEPDDVVLDLLKKEIDARPRFVLCKSSNSIHSYYVQQEISYIKSLNRPYEIVDLDDDNDKYHEVKDGHCKYYTGFSVGYGWTGTVHIEIKASGCVGLHYTDSYNEYLKERAVENDL
jgi:hypothetical protein